MRRSDREIKDLTEIIDVMKRCDVCRLALNDGEYPYILPMNFGMEVESGVVTLYFHSASEGRKLEIIAADNRASFEMDCSHRLVCDEKTGHCTMEYESVIGSGRVGIVDEDKKYEALCVLMSHYHLEEFKFSRDAIPRTTVLKLTVERLTGKRRFVKNDR